MQKNWIAFLLQNQVHSVNTIHNHKAIKNLAKKLCNKKHSRVFWLLFSLTSSVMEAQIFAGYNRRFPQGNQWFLLLLHVMKKKNLNQTDLFLHTGCPSHFKKSALEQLIFSTGIGDNQAVLLYHIFSSGQKKTLFRSFFSFASVSAFYPL